MLINVHLFSTIPNSSLALVVVVFGGGGCPIRRTGRCSWPRDLGRDTCSCSQFDSLILARRGFHNSLLLLLLLLLANKFSQLKNKSRPSVCSAQGGGGRSAGIKIRAHYWATIAVGLERYRFARRECVCVCVCSIRSAKIHIAIMIGAASQPVGAGRGDRQVAAAAPLAAAELSRQTALSATLDRIKWTAAALAAWILSLAGRWSCGGAVSVRSQ
jgi:hypothetical protein